MWCDSTAGFNLLLQATRGSDEHTHSMCVRPYAQTFFITTVQYPFYPSSLYPLPTGTTPTTITTTYPYPTAPRPSRTLPTYEASLCGLSQRAPRWQGTVIMLCAGGAVIPSACSHAALLVHAHSPHVYMSRFFCVSKAVSLSTLCLVFPPD